jgi:uncharacterized protein YifN (PemK superfamily)
VHYGITVSATDLYSYSTPEREQNTEIKTLVSSMRLRKMKKKEGKKKEEIPAAQRDQGDVCEIIRDSALWLWNASEEPVRVGR